MKRVILPILLFFAINAVAQSYNIPDSATLSLNSPFHCSEGLVIKIGKDSLLNIFRIDTSNNHVSNNSYIGKRFSFDRGVTWTSPELLFNSPYDDRNPCGGIINGKIVLFFRELDAATNIGWNYIISSDDKGQTFSSPVKFTGLINDSGSAAYGPIIQADSNKFYQCLYGGFWVQIVQSNDGISWNNPITIYQDTITNDELSEAGIVYIGEGKLICDIRHDNGDYPEIEYVSNDNGNTWIRKGATNLGNGITSATFRGVSPILTKNPTNNDIINLVSIRNHVPATSRDSEVLAVYVNDYNTIFDDSLGWTLKGKVKRPEAFIGSKINTTSFYGYPTTTWLDDTTLFVIFTDDSTFATTHQQASLYQFTITYHPPLAISNISIPEQVAFYPNPANNMEYVAFANDEIKNVSIINLFGQKVLSFESNKRKISISTDNLPDGLYILSVNMHQHLINKQFEIIHQ